VSVLVQLKHESGKRQYNDSPPPSSSDLDNVRGLYEMYSEHVSTGKMIERDVTRPDMQTIFDVYLRGLLGDRIFQRKMSFLSREFRAIDAHTQLWTILGDTLAQRY